MPRFPPVISTVTCIGSPSLRRSECSKLSFTFDMLVLLSSAFASVQRPASSIFINSIINSARVTVLNTPRRPSAADIIPRFISPAIMPLASPSIYLESARESITESSSPSPIPAAAASIVYAFILSMEADILLPEFITPQFIALFTIF